MSKKEKKDTIIRVVERKTTQLHVAATNGEVQRLKLLIEAGHNVNVEDKDGATPLHLGAYNGHLKVVKKLLKSGAKVNAKDNEGATALHNACLAGHVQIVDYLLQKGANIDDVDQQDGTPLLNAACNGHANVVQLLVKKGCNLNATDNHGTTALHYAAYNGHEAIVKILLGANVKVEPIDNDGATPLHHACANGHVKVMRLLVKNAKGANINVSNHEGTTPLHAACFHNHKEAVAELLACAKEHSTGIDLRPVVLKNKDHEGSTPLHKAAFQGSEEIVDLLLQAGANPAEKDKEGATALHKAAFKGHTAVIRLLLERGADIKMTDNTGGTALYNACYNGYVKVVELLLEKRDKAEVQAMINLTDDQGKGPLHAASCFGHWECTSLLVRNGANLNIKDKDEMTPLHLAAFNGSQLSMAFLLDGGADVTIPNAQGVYALHYACYNGWLSTVHNLLEKKAPVNATDKQGATPLHYAAACNHWEVVAYLLYKGAEIDYPAQDGMTPLAYATKNNAIDALVTLLERGADPDYKDRKGNTPRKLSRTSKNNITKKIFDTIGKRPYTADALARLSDFRNKQARRKKQDQGGPGGEMTLNAVLDVSKVRPTSPFADLGFEFDLNAPDECMEFVFNQARAINHHWTVLNLCRLLLLVPGDEALGRRTWNLLEMFANKIILNEQSHTTKLTFKEFMKAWKIKDEVRVKKLDLLQGIENAFPIMFSATMPEKDEYTDVTFQLEESEGTKENAEEEDEEEELEDDEPGAAKKKKKSPFGPARAAAAEGDDEEVVTGGGASGFPTKKASSADGPEETIAWGKGWDAPAAGWGGAPAPPGGGPPPPPPPPGGGPPPPPPPGMKGAGKPLMKMRKLDWKKIPKGNLTTTIWRHLQPQGVELDVPTIIEYFKIPDDENDKNKQDKKKELKTQIVDSKRANHVGLLLSMMKMTPETIRTAVLEVKDHLFTEDNLRAFIKLTPKQNEVEQLKPFLDAPPEVVAKLGDAERFFLGIMNIPRLENRLSAFLFKRTFEAHSKRLKEDIELALLAINELKSNVKFAKVLELILNVGNFLNQGTFNGNCFGFTLDSLLKLKDTKSPTRPEMSVLHYMAWFIAEKRPRLLDFPEELQYISKGGAEFITIINQEHQEIINQLVNLQQELEVIKKDPNAAGDPFGPKMSEFLVNIKEEMASLNAQIEEMNSSNKQMFENFGADMKTDIITFVQQFCTHFMVCRAENKAREEQRERAAQKKQRTVIKKKKTKTSSKTKGLMKAPQLDSSAKELTVDKGEGDDEDEEEELERIFPGKKKKIGEDGQEISDDEDDGGKKPAKKKIKKVIKIKKAAPVEGGQPASPKEEEEEEEDGEGRAKRKVIKKKKIIKKKIIKKKVAKGDGGDEEAGDEGDAKEEETADKAEE